MLETEVLRRQWQLPTPGEPGQEETRKRLYGAHSASDSTICVVWTLNESRVDAFDAITVNPTRWMTLWPEAEMATFVAAMVLWLPQAAILLWHQRLQ